MRVHGVRRLSSLFSPFTTFSDIGLGSDSVCARPSSHRIKSFDSVGSQPSHSRTSKLFQGQYRSLVSLREVVIEIGICGEASACVGVSGMMHMPPLTEWQSKGWFDFVPIVPLLGFGVCSSPNYPNIILSYCF